MQETVEQHRIAANKAPKKFDNSQLTHAINTARDALLAEQKTDGHWCFELEADCTIPAEYILMMHFMNDMDELLEKKIATYLRKNQLDDGGWPLYYGGEADISCTIKAYYALKLTGDNPNEPHMQRAKESVLRKGGAAKANVFTLITLALFQQIPWRATPFIPVEVILFPRWFLFHIDKISYWSRAVTVPLTILCSLKAKAKNPRNVDIQELFITPPSLEKNYFEPRSKVNRIFLFLDKAARKLEWLIPKSLRRKALKRAEAWMIERLNGEHGLGAIFPAMVNAYEALDTLGYPKDHLYSKEAKEALSKLLIVNEDDAYCQPCVSPVWDTALSCLALQEEAKNEYTESIAKGLDWLNARQIKNAYGDWYDDAPGVGSGGWAFQYENDYYPDLDDTAAIGWSMHESKQLSLYGNTIERAANWLAGMQSENGGFAAFDINNTHYYLNEIPFADHGALLDPPTSDVSARCLTFFAILNRDSDNNSIEKCLEFLRREQENDGSWFGRWGTNYVYGTWSVLTALEALGIDKEEKFIRKAVEWLLERQQPDGGWGGNNDSYYDPRCHYAPSTGFQTAWAILALLAAGEVNNNAVANGIAYLIKTQGENGFWDDHWFTSPGFPRVFYLKYHGYSKYFPLWALAKYRNKLKSQ